MPIYQMRKQGGVVFTASALNDGPHNIQDEEGELLVPIVVEGNAVSVKLNKAVGDLESGYICGYPGYMDLRVDIFRKITNVGEPLLYPHDGEQVLRIHDGKGLVTIERHDSPPTVSGEREA